MLLAASRAGTPLDSSFFAALILLRGANDETKHFARSFAGDPLVYFRSMEASCVGVASCDLVWSCS